MEVTDEAKYRRPKTGMYMGRNGEGNSSQAGINYPLYFYYSLPQQRIGIKHGDESYSPPHHSHVADMWWPDMHSPEKLQRFFCKT